MLTCLSVLDYGKVKHYKLRKTDVGHYFVSRTKSFRTLRELVEHYSKQPDGLCVRLGHPCQKVKFTSHYGKLFLSISLIVSELWFLCVRVDGGPTDLWSVLQHSGPMGD